MEKYNIVEERWFHTFSFSTDTLMFKDFLEETVAFSKCPVLENSTYDSFGNISRFFQLA